MAGGSTVARAEWHCEHGHWPSRRSGGASSLFSLPPTLACSHNRSSHDDFRPPTTPLTTTPSCGTFIIFLLGFRGSLGSSTRVIPPTLAARQRPRQSTELDSATRRRPPCVNYLSHSLAVAYMCLNFYSTCIHNLLHIHSFPCTSSSGCQRSGT